MEWWLNSLMSPKVSHHTPQRQTFSTVTSNLVLTHAVIQILGLLWCLLLSFLLGGSGGAIFWSRVRLRVLGVSRGSCLEVRVRRAQLLDDTAKVLTEDREMSQQVSKTKYNQFFFSNIPRFLCKTPPSRASWRRWRSPSPLWCCFYLQSLWGHPWALAKNRKGKKCFHTCTWLLHYMAKSIWTFENKRSALSAQNLWTASLKSKTGFILSVASPLVLCFSVAPARRSGPRSPAPSWPPSAPPSVALRASCWC